MSILCSEGGLRAYSTQATLPCRPPVCSRAIGRLAQRIAGSSRIHCPWIRLGTCPDIRPGIQSGNAPDPGRGKFRFLGLRPDETRSTAWTAWPPVKELTTVSDIRQNCKNVKLALLHKCIFLRCVLLLLKYSCSICWRQLSLEPSEMPEADPAAFLGHCRHAGKSRG